MKTAKMAVNQHPNGRHFVLVLFLTMFFCATAIAQTPPRIAVYVTGSVSENEKVAFGARMHASLISSGRYGHFERASSFLAEIEKAQLAQRGAPIDDSHICALGRQFGVPYVCVASITPVFGDYLVAARILNVETVQIVSVGGSPGRVKSAVDLVRLADLVAQNVLGNQSASLRESAPIPAAPPAYAPAPVAAQAPAYAPAPVAAQAPAYAPAPVAAQAPAYAPAPVAAQAPAYAPAPTAAQAPAHAPAPVSAPEHASAIEPALESAPIAQQPEQTQRTYRRSGRGGRAVSMRTETKEERLENDLEKERLKNASKSVEPMYDSFNSTARLGTWFLNGIVPGLGSAAIMKDWTGAGVQWGLFGVGIICVVNGFSTQSHRAGSYNYKTSEPNALYYIGGTLLATDVIFNIVRSCTYNRPMPQNHTYNQYGDLNIAVFPNKQGNVNAYLLYNMEF